MAKTILRFLYEGVSVGMVEVSDRGGVVVSKDLCCLTIFVGHTAGSHVAFLSGLVLPPCEPGVEYLLRFLYEGVSVGSLDREVPHYRSVTPIPSQTGFVPTHDFISEFRVSRGWRLSVPLSGGSSFVGFIQPPLLEYT